MITIVDYGVGNLASVQNMLKKCSIDSQISGNEEIISGASKIILPGVGAFDAAMQKLNSSGLFHVIQHCAKNGKLILGICLGAQLLLEGSEEGTLPGLSLIKGKCKKFDAQSIAPLRVPHMGWSDVVFVKPSHPLTDFNESQPRFYFTHSFFLTPADPQHTLATSQYGHEFACGIVKDNVMGIQFHPEKSHKFGARLFTNFAGM